MTPSKFATGLKFVSQFGLRPLALLALYRFGLATGHYRRAGRAGSNPAPRPVDGLIPLPGREALAQTLGEQGRRALLAEADEIRAGRFRRFGGPPVELRLDVSPPLRHWTAYELDPGLLAPHLAEAPDLKFLWEAARFGWAFTLGRAWRLTRDEAYAQTFWHFFDAFRVSNPPLLGPHWMNGQEVAIRMLALAWSAQVFADAAASTAERAASLGRSILEHAARLPATLPYARAQDNNHLVTEAAAIYTAGLLFEHAPWRALGWKWLNRAIQSQIGGYGEYIQHSTNYQRLMLAAVLWVHAVKREPWPALTLQALARSAHWLFSLLDGDSGRVPNLGSNDGASILPLSSGAYDDFRPTVQAAARAFLRTGLHPGPWDEMSIWLGLKAAARSADSSSYLTDNLRGEHSWGYLRASNFKSRLAHMDQLHVDLWWRGLNLAQDAGTCSYNGDPPWDNPLVATRVHNTVLVDGRDQMTRAGRFLVLDWAGAYAKPVIELDERVLCRVRAHFGGYRSLGVRHERSVTVYRDDLWRVEDRLVSFRRRPHTYRLHWLLPDWEWELEETGLGARLGLLSPHGRVTLQVDCSLDVERKVSLVRAGEVLRGRRDVLPFEGWASRTYGEKSPALSLAFEVTSPYHMLLTSEFSFPPCGPAPGAS